MADYIYLLQTRLSAAQRAALEHVRQAARDHGATVFLVGGAVRDLTSGSPIRDLDVAVQGNALRFKRELQKSGGVCIGENEPSQTLYFNFPGGVRLEVGSTLSATYPKPGKPVYRPAGILDDLRRRDFTANAMAISLNEGSYGLLLDPLNGVADIENRELRLVSNYGFIEDPVRMIRAARFDARLGWQMEEKTLQRYETGKAESYIDASTPAQRGYELEEIFHEEDPLRVLRKLEAEGWAQKLSPTWSSAKANEAELDRLRDTLGQMEAMGVSPDPSAAFFPLLTAKLNANDTAALKASFARPGFADQIAALEADTKAFAAQLSSKAAAAPSEAWKLIFASAPEPVLWLAHSTKSPALQAKFKAFLTEWSQARQKIPYQLMQEMRIHPDLPGYGELLETIFFAIMDEKLETPEAAKAFLEPFSPPAPPPPVNLRRRAVKRETKAARPRSKKAESAEPIDLETGAEASDGEPPAKAVAAKAGPAGAKAGLAGAKAAAPANAAPAAAAKAVEAKAVGAKAAPAAAKAGGIKVVEAKAAPAAAKHPGQAAAKQPAKALPAKSAGQRKVVAAKQAWVKAPAKSVANRKVPAKTLPKAVAKKAPLKAAAKAAAGKAVSEGAGAAKAGAKKAASPSHPSHKRTAKGGGKAVKFAAKAGSKKEAVKAPAKRPAAGASGRADFKPKGKR